MTIHFSLSLSLNFFNVRLSRRIEWIPSVHILSVGVVIDSFLSNSTSLPVCLYTNFLLAFSNIAQPPETSLTLKVSFRMSTYIFLDINMLQKTTNMLDFIYYEIVFLCYSYYLFYMHAKQSHDRYLIVTILFWSILFCIFKNDGIDYRTYTQ